MKPHHGKLDPMNGKHAFNIVYIILEDMFICMVLHYRDSESDTTSID